MNKIPLIVIIGPTAVGKTELSIELAKALGGEIISGDSMQIYRELNIGTAKITEEEMQAIPHHLIDVKDPDEDYNVQLFQKNVKDKITEITQRNKVPILVGGTGLYVDALVYDYNFIEEEKTNEVRDRLWKKYEEEGKESIFEILMEIDPKSAQVIDSNNIKRVIRAIEVFETSGMRFSELEKSSNMLKESPYDLYFYGLTMDRERLYSRINQRVDLMFEDGWIVETKNVVKKYGLDENSKSMKSLGYRHILLYFKQELEYDEMVELIKRDTRRFAKRQLTWFRKNMDIKWFDKDHFSTEEIKAQIVDEFQN